MDMRMNHYVCSEICGRCGGCGCGHRGSGCGQKCYPPFGCHKKIEQPKYEVQEEILEEVREINYREEQEAAQEMLASSISAYQQQGCGCQQGCGGGSSGQQGCGCRCGCGGGSSGQQGCGCRCGCGGGSSGQQGCGCRCGCGGGNSGQQGCGCRCGCGGGNSGQQGCGCRCGCGCCRNCCC